MNTIKKNEREIIYAYALTITRLNKYGGRVLYPEQTIQAVMQKFGISRDRARTAVAHAARRQRNGQK